MAFDLDLFTSADFNTTTADRSVLHGLPDLLAGKYLPTCQPANLALNSQIFTNNSALKYEIVGIQKEVSSDDDNANARGLPSLTYSNNILEDCEITSVQLELSP
ncbi:hypothetical protein Slin15195_G094180 [Septoria linicola]|uniref:Uncharacterized protein n=1 Tax=Septoria linicola TaxID=215465 RepID=A0A9Q9EN22_9PEZI|nr:hypothetical protein Slin14017_G057310 [Septoria linicola]USW56099.1 hypothetical protein Slin15195_G094180 [Septoria linicola]